MSLLKIIKSRTRGLLLLGTAFLFSFLFIITSCKKDKEPSNVNAAEAGEELAGGVATVFDQTENAFGHSIPGISVEDNARFVVGNSFFRDNWVIAPSSTAGRDGVGPLLNTLSCSGCHFKDGRGQPPLDGYDPVSMLMRLSIEGTDIHGGPLGHPDYGTQLSPNAISGVLPEGTFKITYLPLDGTFDDGEAYQLRKPLYEFIKLNYGDLGANILYSPRAAQQLPGLGLLEAVDEAVILSYADENDSDKDGISGRPNYVWDEALKQNTLGRFGWKANQPNIRQQVAGAFSGDMGITSSLFPKENMSPVQFQNYGNLPNGGIPEIQDDLFGKVVYYTITLSVPGRRNWTDTKVLRGKQLFTEAKCSKCHIPKMKTGFYSPVNELSNQEIRPYTDLLLHDMGVGLADGRPDFLANGNEWRTPPLWGIGLVKNVNKHTYFLHDGRARNFQEAILWHGGEAEQSQKAFKAMSKSDREALVEFLESL
ncbi:di-heme oxidoredictase family protein [Sporocytophaga myxococcoides]|uniref:di-heme oxidoreductase family protein n=1 Tax=Sporocytophaga myxococcoides TaxID=153721 RepID=UPI000410F5E6|nr:di-heme oxidoredictase family protein [Sporocytophaga myxococcoides]